MSILFWSLIMIVTNILELCSGLALFLYGMNVMGDSLMLIAGERIKYILRRISSHRLAAVIFGALVTAVIQSSSAATVMTVGLVEAGILSLGDSVAIIMGANVGTTVTSWLFAAAGVSHNSEWMGLLEPGVIVAVPLLAGVVSVLVSHDQGRINTGNAIAGFAILIYGMEMMTAAVSPLAGERWFTSLLTLCGNPLYAVLAGTFITAVIQSSSASVGILQALCITGNISYDVAIPVIMGQNIGTCITTMLSAAGGSVNAKRTAVIHLYFNIIGTVVFMAAWYALKYTPAVGILPENADAAGIASVHSIFNLASVIIMYPFTGWLVKIAQRTVR